MRQPWIPLAAFLGLACVAGADEIRDRILVNGFMGVEFEKQLSAEGFGDPNGSFDSDVIGLAINVFATNRVRVSIETDWEHGTSTAAGRGGVNLEYGFVEYTAFDSLKIRAGKFLTPFGIFNEIHNIAYTFQPVKLPSPANRTLRVLSEGYLAYPRSAVGLAVRGDFTLGGRDLVYDVLLANGEQTNTNPFEVDDNSAKSVTARLRFEPSPHLRLGHSFYYDKLTQGGFNRILAEGLELELNRGGLKVLSEAVLSWKRQEAGTTKKQLGFYAQAAYRFGNRIAPYVRFELVDFVGTSNDHGANLITGINYELDKNLFLKVENNHFRGAPGSSLGRLPGHGYDQIQSAVCFGF